MNIVHCPIDTRLSFADVREKITQLDRPPQFVLVPREQDEDSTMLDEAETKEILRKEWVEDSTGTTWKLYDDGEVVGIDVNRGWERVVISEKVIWLQSFELSLVVLSGYNPIGLPYCITHLHLSFASRGKFSSRNLFDHPHLQVTLMSSTLR